MQCDIITRGVTMGYYFEPKGSTKLDWLMEHEVEFKGSKSCDIHFSEYLPKKFKRVNVEKLDYVAVVCFVDNGEFYVIAVMYSQAELERFTCNEFDTRPKKWWAIPKADLLAECPDLKRHAIFK